MVQTSEYYNATVYQFLDTAATMLEAMFVGRMELVDGEALLLAN